VIYLDHHAATPVCEAARRAMAEAGADAWANPASVHRAGRAAKSLVERAAAPALAAMGLADAPRFSVPAPLVSWRWRMVAMAPGGYVEGLRGLGDDGPMRFDFHPSDTGALQAASALPTVRRLAWFNHGFQKAEVREGVLVLSDLRMGMEPDYVFRFAVAERAGGGWRALRPPRPARAYAAAGSPGATPAASASK